MLVDINPPINYGEQLIKPYNFDFYGLESIEHVGIEIFSINPYLWYVFQFLELQGNHKHITVKIKVQDLKAGQQTCIPGWHTDTTSNLLRPELPEVHHLFVTSEFALTEFIKTPLKIDVSDTTTLKEQVRQIESNPYEIEAIPACTWVTYRRFNFHRGIGSKQAGKRLLIRVDETDIIEPRKLR